MRGVATFGKGGNVQDVRPDRHSPLRELNIEHGRIDLTHRVPEGTQDEVVFRCEPLAAVCIGHLDQTEHLLQARLVEPDDDLVTGSNDRHCPDLIRTRNSTASALRRGHGVRTEHLAPTATKRSSRN